MSEPTQADFDALAERRIRVVGKIRWYDQDSDPPYRKNYVVQGSVGRILPTKAEWGYLDVVFREDKDNAAWLRLTLEEVKNPAIFTIEESHG